MSQIPEMSENNSTFTDESRPRGCFIPAETLVLNGTAGDNGTASGTLNQPVLGFLVAERNPLWAAFRPVTFSVERSSTGSAAAHLEVGVAVVAVAAAWELLSRLLQPNKTKFVRTLEN